MDAQAALRLRACQMVGTSLR